MLRDNNRHKYLCALIWLGVLAPVFQVSANPFVMGQSIAYSPEQWPDRWSSALKSHAHTQHAGKAPAATPYQRQQNATSYYSPYIQRMANTPYKGFNDRKGVRPWGDLPRKKKSKYAKRKQRYQRNEYRSRYEVIAYPQSLPIQNPYQASFPYSTGIYPGVAPVWGTPGLTPGLVSPYGIAPLGGGWPVTPGMW